VTEASTLTQRYARTVLAPLSRKEAATATKLALEVVLREGTIQRDRVRIYGPSLRIEKPQRRGGRPARLIWVRIRDRDQGVVHEVSVEAEKVIEHVIDGDANPPFSDEERDDAYRVIANDPKLGRLLARKDVGIEWFNPHVHGRGRVIAARLVRVKDYHVVERITEAEVELDEGVLHEAQDHP
jgi:hypothetical protein